MVGCPISLLLKFSSVDIDARMSNSKESRVVGIIIVSHGALAVGLMDAMQMITGSQEKVVAISLQEADGQRI